MKIVLRIVLILVVAAAVAGATVALTQTPALQAVLVQAEPGGVGMQAAGGVPSGALPQAEAATGAATTELVSQSGQATTYDMATAANSASTQRPTDGRGERGGSMAGMIEVIKNLVIVAVITLLVAIPSWYLQRQRGVLAAKPSAG